MHAHAQDPLARGFWRFSLALYARPGVARALLVFQDQRGFDVNIILLALWAGAVQSAPLETADFALADAAVASLRHWLAEPLRRWRRQLNSSRQPGAAAIRQRLLSLELRIERELQAQLVAALSGRLQATRPAANAEVARANLTAYIGEAADTGAAQVILAALRGLMRCD